MTPSPKKPRSGRETRNAERAAKIQEQSVVQPDGSVVLPPTLEEGTLSASVIAANVDDTQAILDSRRAAGRVGELDKDALISRAKGLWATGTEKRELVSKLREVSPDFEAFTPAHLRSVLQDAGVLSRRKRK